MTALVLLASLAASSDLEEHLGARLPLDAALTDPDGRAVRLGDYFSDGRPVVLVLAYYRCPMLCDLVLRGAGDALRRQALALGRDVRAITISFDPRDRPSQAALKRGALLQAVGLLDRADSWPFLVGSEADVRRIAERVGFEYAYDPKIATTRPRGDTASTSPASCAAAPR
jgi:protein SCO1/2